MAAETKKEAPRILIVEDELLIAKDVRLTLQNFGYSVCAEVGSGQEAVEAAGRLRPDLILMDIVLPGKMDGLETAEIIRASWNIPIVFLTGYTDEDKLERAKLTMPYGYVLKPFRDLELKVVVKTALYAAEVQAEQRRNEERQRFLSAMVEQSMDSMITTDTEFRITYMNPSAEKLYGWTLEEVRGKRPDVFNAEPDGGRLRQDIYAAVSRGQTFTAENLRRRKDGATFYCHFQVSPIYDGHGKITGYLGSHRDITERKRAEEALQISESRYRGVFENTGNGVAVYEAVDDGDDFIFIDFNPQAEKIEKIKKENLIGRKITEVFPGIREFGLLDVLKRVWKTSQSEYQPITYYQDERIAGWRDNFVYKLPSGEVVAVYRDVTEQKLAEEALRKSERTFRVLADNVPGLFSYFDADGVYQFANRRYQELFKIDPSTMVGKPYREILGEDVYQRTKDEADLALSGQRVTYEKLLPFKHGGSRWVATELVPDLDEEGNAKGVLVLSIDITDRKRAEEALRKSEREFRILADSVPAIFAYFDADGVYRFANKRYGEWFNLDPSEIIGKHYREFLGEDVYKKTKDYVDRVLSSERVRYEEFMSYKYGPGRWVAAEYLPDTDEKGQVTGFFIVVIDITDRKQAEEALRKSEQEFRILADNVPGLFSYLDANGIYRFANKRYQEWFGIDSSQMVGKHYREALGEDVFKKIKDKVDSVLSGHPVRYEDFMSSESSVGRWIAAEYVPDTDADGTVKGFFALASDITENKKTEEALKASEERFRDLYENAPMAYFSVKSADGSILRCNQAAEKLTGYHRKSLLKMNVFDLYARNPHGVCEARTIFDWFRAGKSVHDAELLMKHRDGHEVWISLTVEPVRDSHGKVVESRSMAIDISQRKRVEEALHKSEQKFRILADNVPAQFSYVDAHGIYRFVNRRYQERFGVDPSEIVGKHYRVLIGEDAYEKTKDKFDQAISGRRVRFEDLMPYKYGGDRWMATELVPDMDESGQVIGYFNLSIDITERKRAEEALRKSEQELHFLADNVPGLFAYADTNLVFRFINKRYQEWFGIKTSELLGQPVREVMGEDAYKKVEDRFDRVLSGHRISYEEFLPYKYGGSRWVATELIPDLDEAGKIKGFFALVRDITEKKQAEEALRQSEKEFRILADNVPALFSYVDAHGIYRFVNRRYQEWFGLGASEIVGKHIRELIGEIVYQKMIGRMGKVLSGRRVSYEDFAPYKYGGGRWITAELLPDLDKDGKAQGCFFVAVDITEQKQNEHRLKESREQLHNLTRYLQSSTENERLRIAREIHDDLGQSLTALKMDMAWLKKRQLRNKDQFIKKIKSMDTAVDLAMDAVERIISNLRPGPLDELGLAAAMEWQISDFQKRTGIKCEFHSDGREIDSDYERCLGTFRILREALTNVARHARAKKVEIRLTRQDHNLILIVKDDGIGITEEKVSHPKSFGLMGMMERASLFGGQVTIKGIPDHGSTITVIIPLESEVR